MRRELRVVLRAKGLDPRAPEVFRYAMSLAQRLGWRRGEWAPWT